MSKLKIPGLRWYIVIMLCMASELNYLDRQMLSVLAQTIQDELGITDIEYAKITMAFLASYTFMYAVCGLLVDKLGSRKSFMIFVTGWSISNMLHALARTAAHFSIFRFMLGATEPASFPGGIRAVSEWFPLKERAIAVGIFNAGTAIGSAMAAPLVAWIALTWGWRWAFVVGGALGLIWVAVWYVIYRLPRVHPWLKASELAHIESDRKDGEEEEEPPTLPFWLKVRTILSDRRAWGCFCARMLTDPISYFFVFWTPKFLQTERGFDLAAVGKYAWIPYVALAFGNISGGAVPGALMAMGWSLNRARKTMMFIASCAMPASLLGIIFMPTPGAAIAMISVAMFFHAAWANMTLPAETFPKQYVGSITGFAGMFGGIVGFCSQYAIGWTVQNISYTPIFIVSSVMHLTAFTLVCVLIGKLGVIRAPGQAVSPATA
jgi:ACS family hexuronate transporter-like MFS transporter